MIIGPIAGLAFCSAAQCLTQENCLGHEAMEVDFRCHAVNTYSALQRFLEVMVLVCLSYSTSSWHSKAVAAMLC